MTFWAAAIIGGATLAGSVYSSRQATKAQNKAAGQQQQITNLQTDAANKLMPWGQGMMTQGGGALTSLLPWYTQAAAGNRTQLQQLMGPQLQQIAGNYDRPMTQMAELTPRDTTAASSAALLAGRNNALNSTILSTRLAGLQGLQGLGSQMAGLGAGAVGASFGGLQGAAGSNNSLMSQLYGIRNQNQQQSSEMGSSIVDFLRGYNQWQANRNTTQTLPTSTPSWITPSTVAPSGGG